MRSEYDRRRANATGKFPLEDDQRTIVMEDRRKRRERRINDLDLEDRQLMLSEMPGIKHLKQT